MASPSQRRFFDPGMTIIIGLGLVGAWFTFRDEGWAGVIQVLEDDTVLFLFILPKVAAGCLIGALITILVPRDMVVRWVGTESGLRGLFIAALAGVVLPGGPFTIFPVAVAFLAIGADRGATIAFVTAWHVMGLNRAIIWEMPFLGHDFVLFRSLISLPFPILAGLLARLLPWPKEKVE